MPLRLPPLSSLRFFEAAGRHQSFKLAAAELNVTPSAVSHGIVGLEQALGVELFVREPRKLSLTPEGADYLPYVAEALSLIAIGTQRLPDRRANRTIAVSCAPTLASRWLLPRLHSFGKRWPNVSVTVDTSQRQVGFPVDGFDFAIRRSRASVAGAAWARLFGEHLVPVCSPAYRDTLVDEAGNIDLRRATLIHVTSVSEDWQAWFDAKSIDGLEPKGNLRFDTIQLAFEAAAAGLGVALGRRPLVGRDLAAEALVEISSEAIVAEAAYWLVSSEGADHRPDLLGFKRWLLREAEAFEDSAATTGAGRRTAAR
jgi:LysR family transcriptional regulator, glycine cleavage system transcriptional activator